MEHSRVAIGGVFPRPGDTMVTNKRRPILTLVEDTSPGIHDTLIAACDRWRYILLGAGDDHDNCEDNLHAALAALDLKAPKTPSPWNMWMNIPVSVLAARSPSSRVWRAPETTWCCRRRWTSCSHSPAARRTSSPSTASRVTPVDAAFERL